MSIDGSKFGALWHEVGSALCGCAMSAVVAQTFARLLCGHRRRRYRVVHLVANPSGEFACTQAPGTGSSPRWNCQRLAAPDAASENKIFDLYTPTHWVTFLRDFSLAAGIAGDKVTSSTMTLNGFAMNCVDFQAAGVPGTSTICTTSQGILGYVKVASDSTSFEIQAFSTSPAASLFELPPGASVTTVTTPATQPS